MGRNTKTLKTTFGVTGGLIALIGGLIMFGVLDSGLATEVVDHPLDPLSTEELENVASTLRTEGLVDGRELYPLITLREPPKSVVLRWDKGDPVPRVAFAIVKSGSRTFEATIDLVAKEVVSWTEVDGVQAGLLPSAEWALVQTIVKGDAEWQSAAARRGIDDFSEVVCVPNTTGYFGLAEEEGRRLIKAVCYSSSDTENYWGRPIEGLIALVDLDERALIRLIDTGTVRIPDSPVDLDRESAENPRTPPNPISFVQPEGPSFEVAGNVVEWQGWRFHVRLDPRIGLVVSTVTYDDDGNRRQILYQGSLSEIFIPYQDPDVGWFFRTYLDAGENGVGSLAVPLIPGLDCPEYAMFIDAVAADDTGAPRLLQKPMCIFERQTGDIAWRHYESVTGRNDSRPRTDLVVRSISAIGNYDYIFDWVFRQDGTIGVDVGATGVPQVKAVDSDHADRDTAHGHAVAENIVATNHDHFFSFRLDLDVDGQSNSFVRERLETEEVDDGSGRASVWVVKEETAQAEDDAKLNIEIQNPDIWRVINPDVVGSFGNPVSYQLEPRTNAISLLADEDFPQLRAGFIEYHLWVTPYHPDEIYAAGTYPNQSKGGAGLPAWTAENRELTETDLVLWYTIGFHHVPRAEDWPVTPTLWNRFELRPFDFFDQNPALDLPETGN